MVHQAGGLGPSQTQLLEAFDGALTWPSALSSLIDISPALFFYASLKNGTYYVTGYGIRPSLRL